MEQVIETYHIEHPLEMIRYGGRWRTFVQIERGESPSCFHASSTDGLQMGSGSDAVYRSAELEKCRVVLQKGVEGFVSREDIMVERCSEESVEIAIAGRGLAIDALEPLREA